MTRARGSSGVLREPYTWLSALVILAFVPVLVRLPALGDLYLHAGTIEQLRRHLLAPLDPMTGTPARGNPYFSPWAVGWAVVARLTGWDVFVVLRLAGAVNLVLFLVALRAFVRSLSRHPWAPVTAFLAICFLWGTNLLYWSGFISLPTLVAGVAYPSTFAVGLTLLLWAGLTRLIRSPPRHHTVALALALGAVMALVALTHQFTALGSGVYALALVLRHRRRIERRTWVALGAGAVVGLAILALWPLFSVFSAAGDLSAFNAAHRALYDNVVGRYALLALALPALVYRLRADPRDPLVWSVAACLAIFLAGGMTGNQALGRIFPPVALLSQVAVGIAIAEWLLPGQVTAAAPTRTQRLYAGCAAAGILAGALFQSGVANLYSPGSYPAALDRVFHSRMSMGDYRWLAAHVPAGATVMTADWDTRAMAPAYGIFTVQPAWADPFLGPAEARRIVDTRAFFRPGTSDAHRARLLARYHTDWVVVRTQWDAPFEHDPRYALVAIRPGSGPREETPGGPARLYRFVG